MKKNNYILIYGKHPFFSVLKAKKRKIYKICIQKQNKNDFLKFLENEKISINKNIIFYMENKEIDKLFPYNDKNHQGYILYTDEKKEILFEDFINSIQNKNPLPKLLILDQILDPHNLGSIIRTSYAFDVKNIIITTFNSVKNTSTVLKTSSGYSEFINLIEVTNLTNAIKMLKKNNYFIIGMDGNSNKTIENLKNNNNLALVMGNEGKGIRELVKKNCDELIKIPIKNNVDSLNVSVASAISIYKIWGENA